jgi:hypothetical protein
VSYINKNDISIVEYIELCESSEEDIIEVLSEDFEDEGRYKDMKIPLRQHGLFHLSKSVGRTSLLGSTCRL